MPARSPTPRVLHVVAGHVGFHLVSPETMAAASEAQSTADATPTTTTSESCGDPANSIS